MKSEIAIGDKVAVNKIKNGYWVGVMSGVVVNLKEGKVQVRTWQNGNRWYSIHNVTKNKY